MSKFSVYMCMYCIVGKSTCHECFAWQFCRLKCELVIFVLPSLPGLGWTFVPTAA